MKFLAFVVEVQIIENYYCILLHGNLKNFNLAWVLITILLPFGKPPGGSHMKGAGMLVISLRGVNFGFWSQLGSFEQNATKFSHQGLV